MIGKSYAALHTGEVRLIPKVKKNKNPYSNCNNEVTALQYMSTDDHQMYPSFSFFFNHCMFGWIHLLGGIGVNIFCLTPTDPPIMSSANSSPMLE